MNNIMAKIYRFMYGRYGLDSLGHFLLLAGFVMGILCIFIRFLPTYIPYLICSFLNTFCYVLAVFRILSKNISRRTLENERFLRLREKLIPAFEEKTKSLRDRNYIYKKCPKCSAKLRLRRIKGKHITKCPKCGTKFNVRVFIEYKDNSQGFDPYF